LQRHPSAFTHRGLAYRQLCRFRDEVADYDRAVGLDPQFTQAYFERAFTTLFFDKRRDAIPDLTRVIELDPQHWLAYNFRGEMYRLSAGCRTQARLCPGLL
jgi:tetratricopeptide (TPR) repeat protein